MKMPFLISIPHGGNMVPLEIRESVCASEIELLEDADAYTRDIYDVGDIVVHVEKTDVTRAIVDLNRATDMLPPDYPDGVVKSMTSYGKPVYHPGQQPDSAMIKQLLNRYYHPYHQSLEQWLQNDNVKIMLDCHSMASTAPLIAPDPGQMRPLINLGNLEGASCEDDLVEQLALCYKEAFGVQKSDIVMNRPFKGGYITRKYGKSPKPVIQIEMSRALYLCAPWFKRDSLEMDPQRLFELKQQFVHVLQLFYMRCFSC